MGCRGKPGNDGKNLSGRIVPYATFTRVAASGRSAPKARW